MNLNYNITMNSTQAKKFIVSLVPKGTPISARTISKRFIEVRIRPALSPFSRTFEYPAELPVALRVAAIKAVYPNSPKLHEQTACGNISAHGICISPSEWDTASAEYLLGV